MVASLFLASGLAGCVAWPEPGTGGMAEVYPSKSRRLRDLEYRFVALTRGPAAEYAPARLLEARGHLIRAKREHAGGLLADASVSTDRVEEIVMQLETRWPARAASLKY